MRRYGWWTQERLSVNGRVARRVERGFLTVAEGAAEVGTLLGRDPEELTRAVRSAVNAWRRTEGVYPRYSHGQLLEVERLRATEPEPTS